MIRADSSLSAFVFHRENQMNEEEIREERNLDEIRNYAAMILGAFGGIGFVSFLSYHFQLPLLIASFGATAVIVYGLPASPVAHPKNVILGHLFSAFIGVLCYQLLGDTWYNVAIAVTMALLTMSLTRSLHPPGGATAIVAVISHQHFFFVLCPVLAGVVILTIWGILLNLIFKRPQALQFKRKSDA